MALTATLMIVAAAVLAGCSAKPANSDEPKADRAVVIVSGGDATTPFTTPDQACASGLAAGNTDTALREYLLTHGYQVFTSPAMAGRGPVVDQTGFGAFGQCPITLPENMTVDSTGSIDLAGEHLARFLNYLHTEKGITEVDLVGHSMGGLFSRSAIKVLATTNSPLNVRSLTTIGTPWEGSYLSDYANGFLPLSDCNGDKLCEQAMKGMEDEVKRLVAGAGREVNQAYLMGQNGWNEHQAGVLDNIPVTLIAGTRFNVPGQGNPAVWPNDGLVALRSALAKNISATVLPHRRCYTFNNTHSIFVSNAAGLEWNTALTWNPEVLATVQKAIDEAPQALSQPNRENCPAAG
jgi:pimeloyl-ACP methyl ester carboxylesterase